MRVKKYILTTKKFTRLSKESPVPKASMDAARQQTPRTIEERMSQMHLILFKETEFLASKYLIAEKTPGKIKRLRCWLI